MKKAFLIIALMLAMSPAYSQLRLGLRAGLSTTDLQVDPKTVLGPGGLDYLKLAVDEAHFGLQGGLVIQATIGKKFIIQPEILFNSNKVDYRITDLDNPGAMAMIKSESYQYLDIPFLLGYRFGPFRLHAGPEAHIFLNSSSDLFDLDGYGQRFKDATYGWMAGLGLDIWNFMLDVRYEGNLSRFGDHITFYGETYNLGEPPSRWLFSLGYMFGKR